MNEHKYFSAIDDPMRVVTLIDSTMRFPEVLDVLLARYNEPIDTFCELVLGSTSSADLLCKIRSSEYNAKERMALLKIFRRCVSPVLDTETSKKIRKISNETLITDFGYTFKPIESLVGQFVDLSIEMRYALAALIGEYDTRGHQGYELTGEFFSWFEREFRNSFVIEGPRSAGRDIELYTIFPEFKGSFPCDFVIREVNSNEVKAVGFARYDSTRGGAQSDDRTAGNANKVEKAKAFQRETNINFKLIFLSDGPGLVHRDTWKEACSLDGDWDGRVRVTTLMLAKERITADWLAS